MFDIGYDMKVYWPDPSKVLSRCAGLKAVYGGRRNVIIRRDGSDETLLELSLGYDFGLPHPKTFEDVNSGGYRAISFDSGLVQIYDTGANLIRKIDDFVE